LGFGVSGLRFTQLGEPDGAKVPAGHVPHVSFDIAPCLGLRV